MKFNPTRFPILLRHSPEPEVTYELEVFGDLKLSWGMEFFIFRMSITQPSSKGIGEVRLLPKDEFREYFTDFIEVPPPDLH